MASRTPTKPRQNSSRLSKDQWLEAALEALAKDGPAILTVEKLCHSLGVSRGSFYWHFADRDAFIQALVNFWDKRLTENFAQLSEEFEGGPSEKLLFLAEMLVTTNAGRYDIPIRAWAARNDLAAKAVKKTDRTRYNYVKSLFEELGHTGEELEMRTRTYVVFYSLERAITLPESPGERTERLRQRHRLLTGA